MAVFACFFPVGNNRLCSLDDLQEQNQSTAIVITQLIQRIPNFSKNK